MYCTIKRGISILLMAVLVFTSISLPNNVAKAEENVISVAEAIANNSGSSKTVEGYIVGEVKAGTVYNAGPTFTVDTNITIADSKDEAVFGKMLRVKLEGNYRTVLGLLTNPSNKGKKIRITGNLGSYYGGPGIATLSASSFIADTGISEPASNYASGYYEAGKTITLASQTSGATVMYAVYTAVYSDTDYREYSQPVVVNVDTTIKAFAKKDGMPDSAVKTFTYNVVPLSTIASIKGKANTDKVFMVKGVVTAIMRDKGDIFIQDETGGILLNTYSIRANINLTQGNEIKVIGKLGYYDNELCQLTVESIGNISVTNSNSVSVEPKLVKKASDLTQVEGQLVKLENVTPISKDSFNNYILRSSEGEVVVTLPSYIKLKLNTNYERITGLVKYVYDKNKVVPRDRVDIIENSTRVSDVYPSTSYEYVTSGTALSLASTTVGSTIYYTVDGSTPTVASAVYSTPIIINGDMTIKAFGVKAGLLNSEISTLNYKILKTSPKIYEIQGLTHRSVYEGKTVSNVEGIVTARNAKGFYIQDETGDSNINTSDAIYVYKNQNAVNVGDKVRVTGAVSEYKAANSSDLPITQISANTITTVSSGNTLPAPIVIGKNGRIAPSIIDNDALEIYDPNEDAIDFYESLEGMYVKVNDPIVVGSAEKYGEIYILSDNGSITTGDRSKNNGVMSNTRFNPDIITVDDDLVQLIRSYKFIDPNFKLKTGDKFNDSIVGVMSYGFGKYRIFNSVALPSITASNTTKEITKLIPSEDKLTIASYNVENYNPNDPVTKTEELAKSIIENLKKPDIIGLVEIQDNDGERDTGVVDASLTYKQLIDEIKKQSGLEYSYTDIDPINNMEGGAPGGNIRVGYLYNKNRVSLVNKPKGDSTTSVTMAGQDLSVNPGRIGIGSPYFEATRKSLVAEFEFKGNKVFVIENHLSSKGGDAASFGDSQPLVMGSEPKRHEQAKLVNAFVKDILRNNPSANIAVLGDMNDYDYSQTIKYLAGSELKNMYETLPVGERYSYVFSGASQVLDNALISYNMLNKTIFDPVNINSEYTEGYGRISDHDPIMLQVDFTRYSPAPSYSRDRENAIVEKPKIEEKKPEIKPEIKPEAKPKFKDVEKHWAKDVIEKMVEKNIVKGVDAQSFKPESKITRAEFISMVVRSLGLNNVSKASFKDVKSTDWFSKEILAAVESNLIKGFNGSLNPNAQISREEIATIIARALESKGIKTTNPAGSKFTDLKNANSWSLDAINKMASFNIINGYDKDGVVKFDPKKEATRAEAITMIMRMLEKN